MNADLLVVDASAAVDLLANTPHAVGVREQLGGGRRLIVPALFDAEVLNALRGLERAGAIVPDHVAGALGSLETFPAARAPLPPLAAAAWAFRERLSLSDAWYVALASAAGAPLLTTDARMARAGDLGVALLLVR